MTAAHRTKRGSSRGDCVLITGGAGFIGCNLAHRLASDGHKVLILDNLSRAGVEQNLAWLQATHGDRVEAIVADIRHKETVETAVARARQVYHLAAQVAVTTSLVEPVHDFTVNAAGTLNLLEAVRAQAEPPSLVFTSTNKVYGKLAGVNFAAHGDRYGPKEALLAGRGVGEEQPLDFASPYGCSKGAADQYVLDYARTFGLPMAVFRMSCIYGPHQFGTEDQGWVAHFIKRALAGETITLYGDGRQVRDILFVDDLVEALILAQDRIGSLQGDAFNIGGGTENTVSLLELLDRFPSLVGVKADVQFDDWRPGDQPWYVSNTGRYFARTGWRPRVGVDEGLMRLARWLGDARAVPADRQRVAS
ncbi:SDR family NAD(P)-dependent oxidoreductase [Azospirillum canadense]|uniref:SDR family NAD(P)-dependent oxidoreductase n=1 Tax=Azospirillum canadense TaxID=403962 RepID=UPI002226A0FF|nr:SDR family NAD(P)-dependent oxidoreductase [Azospirillum canadense]MCW2237123.1 CDP-paratose 2-epimerase [Azospirillum canadense]